MEHGRDFAAELKGLEALLTQERAVAVARLRTLHEAWARALLGVDDASKLVTGVRASVERGIDPRLAAKAVEQLSAAETYQWELGTWSTGPGEGRTSMAEVRTLQIAQAWLWSTRSTEHEEATGKARALLKAASEDPNRSAAPHARQIQALYKRLKTLQVEP